MADWTLDEWVAHVQAALGTDLAVDVGLLLDVARDAAHGVARPAAPLTTFLVGYAAGRRGGSLADVRAVAEVVMALARDAAASGADAPEAGAPGDAAPGDAAFQDAAPGDAPSTPPSALPVPQPPPAPPVPPAAATP